MKIIRPCGYIRNLVGRKSEVDRIKRDPKK